MLSAVTMCHLYLYDVYIFLNATFTLLYLYCLAINDSLYFRFCWCSARVFNHIQTGAFIIMDIMKMLLSSVKVCMYIHLLCVLYRRLAYI